MSAPKENKRKLHPMITVLLKIGVMGILFAAALIFVFGVYRIDSNNMYPALKDGELCITYKLTDYHSKDVVVYEAGGESHFGRVIAVSGDTLDADSTGLMLNGIYASEEIFYPTDMTGSVLELPLTVSEDEFIVLNDYREDQSDSRTFGVITKDDLKGKLIFSFKRRGF